MINNNMCIYHITIIIIEKQHMQRTEYECPHITIINVT